ncbi:MAG: serine protease [Candidatus Nanopelagicales bacterium]|nr:serine protease [Candidatus Nanopelagicales bacterium]
MRLRFLAALSGLLLLAWPAAATAAPLHAPTVIGGTPATIDQAPWQVLLVMRNTMQCSGSLVSPTIVITAAHCIAGYAPSEVRAWAGISRTSERGSVQEIPVATFVTHPSFERRSLANDIAVVTLARPVDVTGRVHTIALPFGQDPQQWPASGTSAAIAGWGVTSTTSDASSDQLMRADITVLAGPGQPCGQYGPDLDPVQDVCAGNAEATIDSCQGDSGGALVVSAPVPVIAGIVSFGSDCAKPGYPGLYTRVTTFLPWLQQQGAIPTATPGGAASIQAASVDGRVVVSWQPTDAVSTGATVWKVSALPSGQTCTTTSTTCEFAQLPAGQAQTFTVQGSNAFGDGIATTLISTVAAAGRSAAVGSALTARLLARWAAVPVQGAVRVTSTTPRICRTAGARLQLRAAGTCRVVVASGRVRAPLTVTVT